jgi:excisionase family DNA binding protein
VLQIHQQENVSIAAAASALPPRGLRIPQAAEYIGCSPWFVEEAIRQGRLKATKMGRPWVMFIEDLDAFIDQEKSKVGAA